MTSIVTITEAIREIVCGPDGRGQHVFTVTNTSGAPLRVGARVVVDDPAHEQWLKIEGEAERDLAENATDQLAVRIQAPPEAAAGKHSFRLLVYSTKEPGEQFTEGPAVGFQVPKKSEPEEPPKSKFPWLIVAIVAGVLLLGGGGTAAWYFWPDSKATVPEIIGKSVDDAVALLEQQGLTAGDVAEEMNGDATPGTIRKQDPKAGAEVEKGSSVNLEVEAVSVVLADLTGKTVGEAEELLVNEGLKLGPVTHERTGRAAGGTVLKQHPPHGERVAPETEVALTVEADSIQVASVIGQTWVEAGRTLSSQGLKVGKVNQRRTGATAGVVLSQIPAAGQPLPPGAGVTLVVEQHPVTVPTLIGKTLVQARRELSRRGLRLGRVSRLRTGRRVGTVVRQTPVARTTTKPGSTVALVIAAKRFKFAAGRYTYTAATSKTVRRSGNVRAGGLTWRCSAKRCTITGPWSTPGIGACKALAKQVGRITSYGHSRKRLTGSQLKKCNA